MGDQEPSRGCLWGTKFSIFSDHKALENNGNVGDHNARVQRWSSSTSPRLTTHLSTEKEAPMVMLASSRGCHSRRLSTTAAVLAASPLSTTRPYISSGLAACSPPSHRSPALAWVGWCPSPIAPCRVVFPLPPTDFRDFGAHGSRTRVDDLPAPTGRFVAHVSAFVGTGDERFCHAPFWPAAAARLTLAGPHAPIGGFSGTAAYGPHLHLDAMKNVISKVAALVAAAAELWGTGV